MLSLDKAGVDKLLLQLEEKCFIDPRYQFVKVNNELKMLGIGGFSYVYEMYDSIIPEKHYAAKVIGLGTKNVDEQLIIETTQIQYFLSEQSENIMRVIALWTMKLHLDDSGNVINAMSANQEGYEESDGVLLAIALMEKLDNILEKDRYGNIELLRDELKTQEGVIRLAKNIGRALFTVHNNGYLHRDIKLENIFWDPIHEQYKLGDFGIARYVGNGDAETIVFTDGYGAPEIERQLTETYNLTADIYSFGIALFLLLNELKFPSSDTYHAKLVQYSKDYIVPAPLNSSEEMARIIRKMCSYQVKDRYQSVEEVLMDIGKTNGSYSNQGFTEYEDFDTETYSGPNKKDEYEETKKTKTDSELTREERKKKKQLENKSYTSSSIWRMIITALLTFFLFNSFSPNVSYVGRWEFWILPIAVFAEAILQRVKELHVEFGFMTVCIAVFSMYYFGIDIPQIVAIIAVLMGIPAITAGVSIGIIAWIAQILTGKIEWVKVFNQCDMGWIVLILLAAVVNSYVLYRADYGKTNDYETFVITWILDKIWYLMIIAGIVLLILSHFKVLVIPEIITHIHLIRTGIGFFAVEIFYIWYYGPLLNEEENRDEPVD